MQPVDPIILLVLFFMGLHLSTWVLLEPSIVIIVSNIVEWLVNRPKWYISAFQHGLLYFCHQHRWFCLPLAYSRSITQYPFTHPGNYRQHVGLYDAEPHDGRDRSMDGPG